MAADAATRSDAASLARPPRGSGRAPASAPARPVRVLSSPVARTAPSGPSRRFVDLRLDGPGPEVVRALAFRNHYAAFVTVKARVAASAGRDGARDPPCWIEVLPETRTWRTCTSRRRVRGRRHPPPGPRRHDGPRQPTPRVLLPALADVGDRRRRLRDVAAFAVETSRAFAPTSEPTFAPAAAATTRRTSRTRRARNPPANPAARPRKPRCSRSGRVPGGDAIALPVRGGGGGGRVRRRARRRAREVRERPRRPGPVRDPRGDEIARLA